MAGHDRSVPGDDWLRRRANELMIRVRVFQVFIDTTECLCIMPARPSRSLMAWTSFLPLSLLRSAPRVLSPTKSHSPLLEPIHP